jgi:murein DD-endopeptidase MepM/ murein hydrolase activator NlpD
VRIHAGIDIAAPAGTQITAPAAGRVKFSDKKFGYGYTVEIDHGNGVVTRYAHCRSLMVRAGDEVADGAVIATVGRSGLATAPHLHYELLVHGRSVDPLRTSLASLLEGRGAAPPATVAPQPTDSALRAPAARDTADDPDVPDMLDAPFTDGVVVSPPFVTPPAVIGRTSVVAGPVATGATSPPAVARDTARRS